MELNSLNKGLKVLFVKLCLVIPANLLISLLLNKLQLFNLGYVTILPILIRLYQRESYGLVGIIVQAALIIRRLFICKFAYSHFKIGQKG